MNTTIITAAMLLAAAPANAQDASPAVELPTGSPQVAEECESFEQTQAPTAPPITLEGADDIVYSGDLRIRSAVEVTPEQPAPAVPPDVPTGTDESSPEDKAATEPASVDAMSAPDESIIVVTGRTHAPPGDPLASVNATTFDVTQSLDKAIVGPVALAYESDIPEPIRDGVSNFLNNLREPLVFLNFLLQLKPGKAAETLGRFTLNSTIGVGGLFDVAKSKPFNLPRRSNGFADTMGYYGVKPGAFLFLPILGPTTVRDAIGGTLDRLLLPTAVGSPFNKLAYNVPTGALNSLDERADFDDQLNKIREESDDPYTAAREYYLAHRRAEIDVLRGKRASVDSPLYETPDSVGQSDNIAAEVTDPAPGLEAGENEVDSTEQTSPDPAAMSSCQAAKRADEASIVTPPKEL